MEEIDRMTTDIQLITVFVVIAFSIIEIQIIILFEKVKEQKETIKPFLRPHNIELCYEPKREEDYEKET